MDRRHLRAEDCVVFLHFLREINTAVCAGNDRFMVVAHLAHTNCGDQGAHTDTCGAEVVDLVDLEQRINFAGTGQNIIDLISSNCIQTASEGVELDQIQVWLCLHIGSCLGLGLGLHVLDEDVLGILRAHARDLFQPRQNRRK